jgi:predicted O-methyltransferase YrrM
MGVQTLAGVPRGFFSPYRYAAGVGAPTGYPELEPVFRAAEARIGEVLDRIDGHTARLAQFAGPPPEPRWDQSWFPRLDGAAAYALVRAARPVRIVEVGSGHSTRIVARAVADGAAADTDAARCEITCIDPAPRADPGGLPVTWRARVLAEEDIPLFAGLLAGDVAFFDSSHLLWPGSDVDMILNRILPVLRPGVLVHLHDVVLPDAYPQAWGWRGYTEQLGLSGWLCGGGAEVVFSSHYALSRMGAATRPGVAGLPLTPGALETSLWLRRC